MDQTDPPGSPTVDLGTASEELIQDALGVFWAWGCPEDEVAIDANAKTSEAGDAVWVQCWVRVPREEAVRQSGRGAT